MTLCWPSDPKYESTLCHRVLRLIYPALSRSCLRISHFFTAGTLRSTCYAFLVCSCYTFLIKNTIHVVDIMELSFIMFLILSLYEVTCYCDNNIFDTHPSILFFHYNFIRWKHFCWTSKFDISPANDLGAWFEPTYTFGQLALHRLKTSFDCLEFTQLVCPRILLAQFKLT